MSTFTGPGSYAIKFHDFIYSLRSIELSRFCDHCLCDLVIQKLLMHDPPEFSVPYRNIKCITAWIRNILCNQNYILQLVLLITSLFQFDFLALTKISLIYFPIDYKALWVKTLHKILIHEDSPTLIRNSLFLLQVLHLNLASSILIWFICLLWFGLGRFILEGTILHRGKFPNLFCVCPFLFQAISLSIFIFSFNTTAASTLHCTNIPCLYSGTFNQVTNKAGKKSNLLMDR